MSDPSAQPLPDQAQPVANPQPASRQTGVCVQHPQTAGVRRCDRCRAIVCTLCDFAFPGNLHVCPKCVAAPTGPMASKRTGLAIAGLFASGLSIAVLGSVLSGVYQAETETEINLVFLFLVTLPAALGLALSYSAMDRNLGNNALLWTASVLSSVEMGVVFTLIIIGNLST